MIEELREGREE